MLPFKIGTISYAPYMFRRIGTVLLSMFILVTLSPLSLAKDGAILPANLSEILKNLQKAHVIDAPANFRPAARLTRAEALSLVFRSANSNILPLPGVVSPWKDVPAEAWYASNVNKATQMGLIAVSEDHLFHPESSVTKGELLELLYKYRTITTDETWTDFITYPVYADVHPWDSFYAAASWARYTIFMSVAPLDAKNVTTYGADAVFHGEKVLNREEAAKIMYLFVNMYKTAAFTPYEHPLGYFLPSYAVTKSQLPETISMVTTFTGEVPTHLPTKGTVYFQIVPKRDQEISTPKELHDAVPALGNKGVLNTIDTIIPKFPSFALYSPDLQRSVSITWTQGKKETPLHTGTDTGSLLRAAKNITQQLGINGNDYGTPDVFYFDGRPDAQGIQVNYVKTLDNLPVYDEVGNMYAPLSIGGLSLPETSFYDVNVDFPQVFASASYPLLPWEEVLAQAEEVDEQRLTQACCFLPDGSIEYHDAEWNAHLYKLKEVQNRYTDAKEVMVRYPRYFVFHGSNNNNNDGFMMPAIRFEGRVVGITTDGEEVDLGPIVRMLPRVQTSTYY